MTDRTDLIVPLSELEFDGDRIARATAAEWDTIQIGALLQHVINSHVSTELEAGESIVVSVTLDVSEPVASGELVTFESRIDRRTRTLVFASGTATQAGRHLLKATVVFRIG
nr:hypothetical protein [Hyphomonas sp. Mor2]